MNESRFTELKCQRCGGRLTFQSGNTYVCESCGKTYEKQNVTDFSAQLNNALDGQKQEAVANLRQLLWKETHEEFVSNKEVERICNEIKTYLPDDFYANFYLATCKKNGSDFKNFIFCIDIEEHYDDISGILDYVLKSLKPEWTVATANLIERAYKDNDLKLHNKYATKFEEENEKIEGAVYEPSFPRDVFIAYSSKDMPEVERVVGGLEKEGYTCFVSARNLRHGSGAVENYKSALETAMNNCRVLVFISSANSRDVRCDAYKELNYIKQNRKDMPRIEYLIKNYSGRSTERFFEEFFDGLTYCTTLEDVAKRVGKGVMDGQTVSDSQAERYVDKTSERERELKKAKSYVADGKYSEAKAIYEKVKEETPDDMEAYIGLIRVASHNYTIYAGEELERFINSAQTMFGRDKGGYKIRHDAEYRDYDNKRIKYLKECEERQKKEFAEQKKQEILDKKREKKQEILYSKRDKNKKVKDSKQRKSSSGGAAVKSKPNFFGVFIASEILFAALFIAMLVLAIITQNAYYIAITVGCGVVLVQNAICYLGLEESENLIIDLYVATPAGIACFVLFCFGQQITAICAFFISLGFVFPLAVYFILAICKCVDHDDDVVGAYGCFGLGGLVFFIISLIIMCNIGFGEFRIKDGELTRYNACNQEVVTVSDGVTSIGDYAFNKSEWEHNEIVEIILPEGITIIGDYAFANCSNLTTINIPESVTYVSPTAFEGTSVTELYLPAGVTESVAYLAYAQSYTVSESNTAFYTDNGCLMRASDNCLMLVSSDGSLAENISSVAAYAYGTVKSAVSVTFPENISTVEENTFYNCSAAYITIGADVTTIESGAFSGCSAACITIEGSVTKIMSNAFYGCTATEIVVQEGVTTIERSAFSGSQPEKITVPFIGCYISSTTAYFGDIFGTEKYDDISTYKDKGKNRIPESLTSVTVLGGEIYDNSFYGCKNLTEVILGDNVTTIGAYAFYNCKNITQVTLGDNITSIGEYAFYGCKSITQVALGSSVTSIGAYAFGGCKNISALYICEGLISIGERPFGNNSVKVDVFYEGSEEAWNNIGKYTNWAIDWYGGYATVIMHYNYDMG